MQNSLVNLFGVSKPLIGMIHLAGESSVERIDRAQEELAILNATGFSGAIIEDYHGSPRDVYECLKASSLMKLDIVRGVNVLQDPYIGFEWASKFGARFVQFDSVLFNQLDVEGYRRQRQAYPEIYVFGGVRFKYKLPTGNSLDSDLEEGKERCDAIVTTGEGTGIETPIEKLRLFKSRLGDFPLIVGAGVTAKNISDQLIIADGAIIGTNTKYEENTKSAIDPMRCISLVELAQAIRERLTI